MGFLEGRIRIQCLKGCQIRIRLFSTWIRDITVNQYQSFLGNSEKILNQGRIHDFPRRGGGYFKQPGYYLKSYRKLAIWKIMFFFTHTVWKHLNEFCLIKSMNVCILYPFNGQRMKEFWIHIRVFFGSGFSLNSRIRLISTPILDYLTWIAIVFVVQ